MRMQVYKFGGASLRDAKAVEQMVRIVDQASGVPMVIVVSAMGKTTNALEKLLRNWYRGQEWREELNRLRSYHASVIKELGLSGDAELEAACDKWIKKAEEHLEKPQTDNFQYHSDQVVCLGELLSSLIVTYRLRREMPCHWQDARQLISTDALYGEAIVKWEETQERIRTSLEPLIADRIILTQGFIGSYERTTTTLGREGSDYSAAIFACAMHADSLTVWKDVPGVLNADPKLVKDTILLPEIPYHEAAEMTYYGAKVIHPKTIRPLANQQIPLKVRSFAKPESHGTIIHDCRYDNPVPAIIWKEDQCLFSFKVPDFEFVNDEHLHKIFETLQKLNINIYMIQNSAISVSVAMDNNQRKIQYLFERLEQDFRLYYNTGLRLITIKNYNQEEINRHINMEAVILEQRSRHNFRALVRTDNAAPG